ncbi:hypothetical protein DH2020_008140 [Rehmannia glutinosa]|uniref:TF-B3 domain-containing protein n=1 Tax=Rehmannia glutinosa TaxID=99300 RepID=A0ABR0U107_REHGL
MNQTTMKFFKVLLPGFESKLWLPIAFCAKAIGNFPGEAHVTTRLGTWKIEVGKSRGRFYFQGINWDDFIQGHELSPGDFIVFEHHQGSMNFNALVFDKSACEKEFPVNWKMNRKDEKEDGHGVSSSVNRRIPPFKKIMCASSSGDCSVPRLSCMYFPVEIWNPNDLHKKKGAILRIEGCSGKEWPVKLTFYKGCANRGQNYDRLAMNKGWFEFCSSNNIKKGDVCTFEIVDTNSGDSDDVIIINVIVSRK